MVTTEPVYEFVKGQGWLAMAATQHSRMFKGFRISVENRSPKAGERYFRFYKSDWETLDECINDIFQDAQSYGSYSANKRWLGHSFTDWRSYYKAFTDDDRYWQFAVIIERVAPPPQRRASGRPRPRRRRAR